MRKIDKSTIASTAYKEWESKLTDGSHDKYVSSHPQHKNILASLLICQDGLCAYTEIMVLDEKEIEALKKAFNKEGNYSGKPLGTPVDIEHFDSSLKTGTGWKWSNLFVADMFVNERVKRYMEPKYGVDEILKPDRAGYDPFKLLEFDWTMNMFIPKTDGSLTEDEETRIENMLIVLGINCPHIKRHRENYISNLLTINHYKETDQGPTQFVTAYQMITAAV